MQAYVGQSENVVLRRNRAEFNVDGFEVENTENADVYDNVMTHNTGGIGVFNLPNLPAPGGNNVRVFNNQIVDNNTANFAPKASAPSTISHWHRHLRHGHQGRRSLSATKSRTTTASMFF
jgi:parallel beta-helix repeat protein